MENILEEILIELRYINENITNLSIQVDILAADNYNFEVLTSTQDVVSELKNATKAIKRLE